MEAIGDDPVSQTNFNKIFSRIPSTASVFIKMDIEGWEYQSLPGLEDYFDRITGIAVEFHHVDTMLEDVCRSVSNLEKSLDIVHVHINNGGVIDERGIPDTVEMTFENKRLNQEPTRSSERTYPVDGLDFPNVTDRKDYKLEFRDDIQECSGAEIQT
ncbi:MAG: FkbM family methyltransferase [Thermodesulfobacteriota bacterium]